jgi:4-amino-4-deoxy-L-arabinose transferase-like glycosyltransferase
MPGLPSRHRRVDGLAVVCLIAFALRLFVVLSLRDMGLFADMQEYHDRALHLLNTGTLPADAFRVPVFSILMAGIYKVFGPHLLAIRLAQALMGTVTVALTYAAARRVVSSRGALLAAFLVAIYPALLLYTAYTMAETTFTLFVMVAIVLWLRLGWWAALGAGLATGAATLTRSVGVAVVVGVVVTALWNILTRRPPHATRVVTRLALFVAGFAIVLAPWVQRNYAIYQRFIPTDTSSGFNALLGNYPGATGRHPGIPAVEAVAKEYWGTTRNDVDRSDVGLRVAREFVLSNPVRSARLALLKVGYLYGVEGREHAWGYSYHLQGRRSPRVVQAWGMALIVSFPLLMTLASVGLWRPGLTQSAGGVLTLTTLIAVTAVHVASFGDTRFHLPWIPVLAILAARAFAPLDKRPWTLTRQTLLAMWLVVFALVWRDQAAELMAVLPKLAESPTPLGLPY